MSKFTIEQLEALKEGTTPGAWAAVADYPHISIVESADEDGRATSIADIVSAKPEITPDQNLMAAAPALLDQLITTEKELKRVRNSIEEIRDSYVEDSGTVGHTQEEQIELDTQGETAKIRPTPTEQYPLCARVHTPTGGIIFYTPEEAAEWLDTPHRHMAETYIKWTKENNND